MPQETATTETERINQIRRRLLVEHVVAVHVEGKSKIVVVDV